MKKDNFERVRDNLGRYTHARVAPDNRECLICGKGFRVKPYKLKNGRGKYCSLKCKFLGTRGNPAWNKGLKGYMAGEKNVNWKGGVGTERHRLMGQIDYKLWRLAIFMRDDYTCQSCNQRGGNMEADHIKPWSLYPELRYAIDNGRTLCISCHRQTDTWGQKVHNYESE